MAWRVVSPKGIKYIILFEVQRFDIFIHYFQDHQKAMPRPLLSQSTHALSLGMSVEREKGATFVVEELSEIRDQLKVGR